MPLSRGVDESCLSQYRLRVIIFRMEDFRRTIGSELFTCSGSCGFEPGVFFHFSFLFSLKIKYFSNFR